MTGISDLKRRAICFLLAVIMISLTALLPSEASADYVSTEQYGQAYLYTVNGTPAYCIDPYLATPSTVTIVPSTSIAVPWDWDIIRAILATFYMKDYSATEFQKTVLTRTLIQEAAIDAIEADPKGTYVTHDTSCSHPTTYEVYANTVTNAGVSSEYYNATNAYSSSYGSSYAYGSMLKDVYAHQQSAAVTAVQFGNVTLTWDSTANAYVGYTTCDQESASYYINDGNLNLNGITFTYTNGQVKVTATKTGVQNYFGTSTTYTTSPVYNVEYRVGTTGSNPGSPAYLSKDGISYLIAANQETQQDMVQITDAEWYDRFTFMPMTMTLEEEQGTGTVVVQKTSDDGVIAGWTFSLTGGYTATTDENGTARFTDIPAGTYTLTENGDWTKYNQVNPQTITVTAGRTTGILITNTLKEAETGNVVVQKTSDDGVIAGWTFTLTGGYTATTDVNGTARFTDIPVGTYTLTEEGDWTKYNKVSSQTITVTAGKTTGVLISNTVKKGSVVVQKTSEDGIISGWTFSLDGEYTATTDKNGTATFSDIPPGTYTLTENGDWTKYNQIASQSVTVTAGNATKVTVNNTLKKGEVVVQKTSDDGVIAGWTFTLSGGYTATTDKNGTARFTDIPVGTYTLTEEGDWTKYNEVSPKSIIVKANETTGILITNTLKEEETGTVVVQKTSEDGVIAGWEFTLDGEYTATTDKNGKATFTDIPVGTYTLTEEGDWTKYNEVSSQSITVVADSTTKVTVNNTLKKGTVVVQKTSEDGVIAGWEFTLDGEYTATTDKNGTATFTDIPVGTYTLTEEGDWTKYNEISSQSITVAADSTTKVTINNTLRKESVVVQKTSEDGVIAGWTFTLSGGYTATTDEKGIATFSDIPIGTYTLTEEGDWTKYNEISCQSITVAADSTTKVTVNNTLKKGTVVVQKTSEDGVVADWTFTLSGGYTATTDESGKATFTDIPVGTYTLTEEGDWTKYNRVNSRSVTVTADSTTKVTMNNTLKKGTVVVQKTSEDGVIAGWTFTLSGGYTATTDKNGTATFTDIPIGTYTLTEQGDWTKYNQVSSKSITVTADSTTKVTVNNTLKNGSVLINKSSSDGKVAGWQFTLSNSSYSKTGTTDSSGTLLFSNVPLGTYTLTENGDWSSYQKIDPIELTVTAGETTIENITNVPIGTVKVTKTSDDFIVAGKVFQLKDSDGNTYKATTSTSGIATLNAPAGTYTLTEEGNTRYEAVSESITVYSGVEKSVSIHNTLTRENLSRILIQKTDAETGSGQYTAGKSLAGITFDIYNKTGEPVIISGQTYEDGEKILSVTTSSNGTAETERIFPFGTYEIRETQASEGYLDLSEGVQTTIDSYSSIAEVEIQNQVIRNNLLLNKIDSDKHEGLSNRVFRISLLDDSNKKVESHIAVTDKEGWIDTKTLLSAGEIQDINKNDQAVDSSGKVDTSKISSDYPVWFYGYSSGKNYYKGSYTRGAFVYGKYLVEELETDSEYIVIDPFEIELKATDGYVQKIVLADYKPPVVDTLLEGEDEEKEITPSDEMVLTDHVYLSGLEIGMTYSVTGTLYDRETGKKAADDNGEEITSEVVTFKATAQSKDVNLEYSFSGINLAEKRLVSFVTVSRISQLSYIDPVTVASHADIQDDDQTVYVKEGVVYTPFLKLDASTEKPLQGAVYRITDKATGESADYTTDEEGYAYLELGQESQYTYEEITAPEGYERDTSVYSFETDEEGVPDQNLTARDVATGTAVIQKRNALTGDPIEGAEISVYDAAGTVLFTQKTDKFGKIYFDASVYTEEKAAAFAFKEVTAPTGFYLNTEVYAFTVDTEGNVSGTTMITDVPKGTVSIKKTDQNGATLPGAKLSIYSASTNTLLGQATTGSTGRVYFVPPEAGTYYFVEDEAPTGYERNTAKYTFTLNQNGVISGNLTMIDKKSSSASTGDNANLPLAITLTVMLTGSAAALIFIDKKKNKKNKSEEGQKG